MHIPDGFLSTEVALALDAGAAVAVGAAVLALRREASPRLAAAPAVGALVFAAQMLNVHVAGGTSGHLIGAVLACMLLGAPLGFLTMAVVLSVQALAFADGGALALGANVLVMGGLGALAATAARRLTRLAAPPLGDAADGGGSAAGRALLPSPLAAGLAAVVATLAGACAVGALLELSGTAPRAVGIMAETHVPIALIEGAVTALVVAAAARLPQLSLARRAAVGGLLAGLVALTPLAAAAPDGLERVALDLGFAAQAGAGAAAVAIAPDYAAPGLAGPAAETIGAAVIGIVLVALALATLAAVAGRRGKPGRGTGGAGGGNAGAGGGGTSAGRALGGAAPA